jgi:hypothetical protein
MSKSRALGCTAGFLLLLRAPAVLSEGSLPVAAEATKIAAAWLGAVAENRAADVVRASAYPFRVLGFESPACKGDKTAREVAALRALVLCANHELVTEGTRAELGKDDLEVLDDKTLKKAGWNAQRKHLRELMRDERLVWRIYHDEDVLHIVVLGVRTTPDGPKATSVTYHSDTLKDD